MFARQLKRSGRQVITQKGFLCGSDAVAKRKWRKMLKRDSRIQEATLVRVRGGCNEIAESVTYC